MTLEQPSKSRPPRGITVAPGVEFPASLLAVYEAWKKGEPL